MSKTEINLPDDTMGGRIRKMRQKANLSQVALYNSAFPYGEAKSDESKARVIRDWEIAGKKLDSQKLIGVCRALNCSSDYLLGLDECTNKVNQLIHDQTGLSENAIEKMLSLDDNWMLPLDFLLRSDDFEMMLFSLYGLAFSSFTCKYADLKEASDLFTALSHDSENNADVFEIRINKSLVYIADNIRKEAVEKAVSTFNSPSGSRTFDQSVETFKKRSCGTFPDDGA